MSFIYVFLFSLFSLPLLSDVVVQHNLVLIFISNLCLEKKYIMLHALLL